MQESSLLPLKKYGVEQNYFGGWKRVRKLNLRTSNFNTATMGLRTVHMTRTVLTPALFGLAIFLHRLNLTVPSVDGLKCIRVYFIEYD